MITIENGYLKVNINEFSARLNSILCKFNKKEYLTKNNSHLYFPFVGNLKNDSYSYEKEFYKIMNYDLFKNLYFQLEKKYTDKVIFKLTNSSELYEVYPFEFQLYLQYSLDLNRIKVEFLLKNLSNKPLFFQLAYDLNLSLLENSPESYLLTISPNKDTLTSKYTLNEDNFKETISKTFKPPINFSKSFFKDFSFIFKNKDMNIVSFLKRNSREGIVLQSSKFDYTLIKNNNLQSINLKLMNGINDSEDENEDLSKKKSMKLLEKDKTFKCLFTLEMIYC
ncbi:MAG: hypothetical protein ACRC0W_00315 [Cetobacterium sp.]